MNERLHGIDALRGLAMVLGVFLHAAIAYKIYPVNNWPYDVSGRSYILEMIYAMIHSFRMPLFFLIAGFFSRMVLQKDGVRSFLKKRTERILLPFVFSLLFILPLTIFPFLLDGQLKQGQPLNIAFKNAMVGLMRWNGLAHLWFLYYLLIYYIGAIALYKLPRFLRILDQLGKSWLRLLVFLVAGALVTLLPHEEHIDIPIYTGLFPPPSILLFYSIFFFAGFFLFTWKEVLVQLKRKSAILMALCLIFQVSYIIIVFKYPHGLEALAFPKLLMAKLIFCLCSASTVLFSLSLVLNLFQKSNSYWRYLADASYWIYLLHMSLVALCQVAMLNWEVSIYLKFILSLIVSLSISCISYEVLIRYTWVGTLLHGKRVRSKNK